MRTDWDYEFQTPTDRRLTNSAYQNFAAGRIAGIDEVGVDLFGRALIELDWAKESSVEHAISYFKGAYQNPKNVIAALHDDTFGQIFKYARKAGVLEIVWANGGTFRDPNPAHRFPEWVYEIDIRRADLSGILDIPPGYGGSVDIHHAIISNPGFKNAVDSTIQ